MLLPLCLRRMEVASWQVPSCAGGRKAEPVVSAAGPKASDGEGFFSQLHQGPGLNLIVTCAQLAHCHKAWSDREW